MLCRECQTEEFTSDPNSAIVEPAGKFRIYLGAAAGVGKTVSMLEEGLRRKGRGSDVIVGLVETHGRRFTEDKLHDFEIVPRRTVNYKGGTFYELDVESVIGRNPDVVLIDELAHSNIPESGRNSKRWEDILQILDAGISVITTVNIQHLESVADAVEIMTGAGVRERVPDWVVRGADQIELVDSSPEQLRRRLLHGNIYPKERVSSALANFFRFENLAALRELALRFVADETEEEMLSYLDKVGFSGQWETTERIMVALTGIQGSDQILRRAARMAARARCELKAVHVSHGDRLAQEIVDNLTGLEVLTANVGAQWVELQGEDIAQTLVNYARTERITQIVIGSTFRNKFAQFAPGSLLRKIMRMAAEDGIDVHIIARRNTREAHQ